MSKEFGDSGEPAPKPEEHVKQGDDRTGDSWLRPGVLISLIALAILVCRVGGIDLAAVPGYRATD